MEKKSMMSLPIDIHIHFTTRIFEFLPKIIIPLFHKEFKLKFSLLFSTWEEDNFFIYLEQKIKFLLCNY